MIYSVCFFADACPTAETTILTVAAADTVVLRDAEWFNSSAEVMNAQLQSTVPGFGIAVVCRSNGIPIASGAQWQGRVVLPGGSTVQLAAPGAGLYLHLSGYQFTS